MGRCWFSDSSEVVGKIGFVENKKIQRVGQGAPNPVGSEPKYQPEKLQPN